MIRYRTSFNSADRKINKILRNSQEYKVLLDEVLVRRMEFIIDELEERFGKEEYQDDVNETLYHCDEEMKTPLALISALFMTVSVNSTDVSPGPG